MLYVECDRIEPGELLFHDDFTDPDLEKRLEVSGGDWKCENGYCTGVYRENGGGLIYTLEQFPGDVMLDFYGTIIPPCHNDLNFSFRARGWDYEKNDADVGYIAGLNGWWIDRTGIERYPECALRSLCEYFKAEPGREYHIQTGIVNSICFLAVDGNMILTMADPDPIIAEDCNRVGLGTYCSQIQFRDFKVYRPIVTHEAMEYVPNF
jgi:hypothetical protein